MRKDAMQEAQEAASKVGCQAVPLYLIKRFGALLLDDAGNFRPDVITVAEAKGYIAADFDELRAFLLAAVSATSRG